MPEPTAPPVDAPAPARAGSPPHRRRGLLAVAAGIALLATTAVAVLPDDGRTASPPATATPTEPSTADPLTDAIAAAQERLRTVPEDAATWAELGSAYVEQARVTADPSYYALADGALAESVRLNDTDNVTALAGLGALANARHEFSDGAANARAALALDPASATAFGVLADALVQLGDYPGATAAVQGMLDLQPGLSSFTRASYDLELRGLTDQARGVLERALESSASPADTAFCRTYLGQLAFSQGDLDTAEREYTAGLAVAPDEPGLLAGSARVAAARGQDERAVELMARVVQVRPLPEYLAEHGELLESLGRTTEAEAQYALFDTAERLFTANGVRDSLTAALLAANRGRGDEAVALAEAERAQRQNIDSADALGWALHVAGRDAEALPLVREATALGTRNASFLFHRGMVEAALGLDTEARASLSAAVSINPGFSPLQAPVAQQALADLGGPL